MAPKLNVSTSGRKSYGDFTKNYRQSSNVEDRRVPDRKLEPDAYSNQVYYNEDGSVGSTGGPGDLPRKRTTGERPRNPDSISDDEFNKGGGLYATRKVDPEEAIRKTNTERK